MRYYKNIIDGYILSIGTGVGGEEISQEEYNQLYNLIKSKPCEEGYSYKLKEALNWEKHEVETEETEPTEEEYAEAGKILMGVSE